MTYFRENIQKMAGYVPGEQPAAGVKVVKLNTNENPYPPAPKVIEAVRAIDETRHAEGVVRLVSYVKIATRTDKDPSLEGKLFDTGS